MTVTAPETAVRRRLIDLLETEFASDGLEVRSDKLNDSLGLNGNIAGVYPGTAIGKRGQEIVQETAVFIQIFRKWDKEVNPNQTVDPADIEEWAERLRRAARVDNETGGGAQLWFYEIQKIEYPPDPTGNVTRLLATVLARSQNSSVVETTG